jgi:hypothetical protein
MEPSTWAMPTWEAAGELAGMIQGLRDNLGCPSLLRLTNSELPKSGGRAKNGEPIA